MKNAIAAVLSCVGIVLVFVLAFSFTTTASEPAQAAESPGCLLELQGTLGIVVCGGEVVEQLPLPEITVVGPTVTLPPITITDIATVTLPPRPPITIRPPVVTQFIQGPTRTVEVPVPGPTRTVTARETETVVVPGPRETETVFSGILPTETVTVSPEPTATVTETVESDPLPPVETSDTIEDDDTSGFPDIDFGDGDLTPEEVGLSTLTVLALVGLLLLALYAGYAVGYKDKERQDTNFIRALLDNAGRRGKHS